MVVYENLNFALLHHTDARVGGSKILQAASVSGGFEAEEGRGKASNSRRLRTIPITVP